MQLLKKYLTVKKLQTVELERKTVEEFKSAKKIPIVIILDNIRSLNNVGSVFRTADAFLVERILLCGITGCPPHRDIQKTALGATETVNWEYFENTESAVKKLKEEDFEIIAIEQTDASVPLQQFNPDNTKRYALIFGNEVNGVSEEILPYCNLSLEIPQYGYKHSLNISVTVGIIIWDFVNKIKFPSL